MPGWVALKNRSSRKSYLKLGSGDDCAGQMRFKLFPIRRSMVVVLSSVGNFGLAVPIGSKVKYQMSDLFFYLNAGIGVP